MKNTPEIILTLIFCCQFTTTQAQYTDVIYSNRPGASQSAFSVGTKVLQFELGPYLVKEKRSLYPNYEVSGYGVDFAVHYGIWKEALELNVQGTYQNDTQSFTSNAEVDRTRANFKNLNIGVKYLVYDPNKNKDFWYSGTNAEQPLTRHTHVEVLSAPFQNFLQASHHHSCVTIFHKTSGLHQNRARRTNGL
jgi:hypothetical protein